MTSWHDIEIKSPSQKRHMQLGSTQPQIGYKNQVTCTILSVVPYSYDARGIHKIHVSLSTKEVWIEVIDNKVKIIRGLRACLRYSSKQCPRCIACRFFLYLYPSINDNGMLWHSVNSWLASSLQYEWSGLNECIFWRFNCWHITTRGAAFSRM